MDHERRFLINPAHTPPSCGPVSDPGNVEPRHLNEQIARVVPAGEPSDRNRPIKPDHTRCDRVLNVGELLEVSDGRNQVPCRLRSDVETATHPLTQRPAPSPGRHLTPINLTQQPYLKGSFWSNHGFTAKQLLLNPIVGGGLDIHTRNLSTRYDRNRVTTDKSEMLSE